MDIGKEIRIITVEPAQVPIPAKEPATPEPLRAPKRNPATPRPRRTPRKVPAR